MGFKRPEGRKYWGLQGRRADCNREGEDHMSQAPLGNSGWPLNTKALSPRKAPFRRLTPLNHLSFGERPVQLSPKPSWNPRLRVDSICLPAVGGGGNGNSGGQGPGTCPCPQASNVGCDPHSNCKCPRPVPRLSFCTTAVRLSDTLCS